MSSVLVTILSPFAASILVGVSPAKFKARLAMAGLGLTFAASIVAFSSLLNGAHHEVFYRQLTGWFNLSFASDGLAVFMAALSSFVALLIGFYSLEYMREYVENGQFYFWTTLFVASMMGLVFSANLILFFCFWELTSVSSWKLIGFYRKDKDLKSADKAFLVTFFGASLMMAGLILIYLTCGTLEMGLLKGQPIPSLAAFLLLAGIVSKSAQLPLQGWLPDAGVAPTPVTALLHAAVLVKIGVYAFARFFNATFIASAFFYQAAVALSACTILVAAGSALVENNMKRILAYSTISQLGYILLAFALNTATSFKVALVYIAAHSIAKAGLFLCCGIIEHRTGTKDIRELGGLMKQMPWTATAYLLCAFSIIGVPPFFGFWPKFLTVVLCVQRAHTAAALLAVLGALFTMFYLMRLFSKVFLGEAKVAVAFENRYTPMVMVVVFFGVLSLVLGLVFRVPFYFVSELVK